MFLVEIFDKADFCKVQARFVCPDQPRANFWAGVELDKLTDADGDGDYDYSVTPIEERA